MIQSHVYLVANQKKALINVYAGYIPLWRSLSLLASK